jgi:urea transporter/murein DD-endopeptidase MepM/ murein hydrolase activator NlpD
MGLKKHIQLFIDGVLHSYAQVLFSKNKLIGIILLLLTFFHFELGITGLFAVLIMNGLAYLTKAPIQTIQDGLFGFNAIFLGIAMAFSYKLSINFLIILSIAIVLMYIVTLGLMAWSIKTTLPFLSLPFLICIWIVQYFIQNTKIGPVEAVSFVSPFQNSLLTSLENIKLPYCVDAYFRMLSTIFFQNSLLVGVIIALVLLYYSRIAFSLSVIGFGVAYLFYHMVGLDKTELFNSLNGVNFIFMPIALGGFFIIPSKYSYLVVILLTPVLALLLIASKNFLALFQLNAYSLPFTICTILSLYVIKNNYFIQFLKLTTIQYYSPEKTIYKYANHISRFANSRFAKIKLPIWGKWKISQGYNGKLTHLGLWANALDFVIVDDKDIQYQEEGTRPEQYFCYNKPVLAPADGYVYNVINTVDDNSIGGVDTDNNWGNTIILNHLNGLYSQLSHIKKDSIKVAIGDYVKKDTILAYCGNSGRSPVPHLHYQLQLSPELGAITYPYKFSQYIKHVDGEKKLISYAIPQEGDLVSNVEISESLSSAFNFKPNDKVLWANKENKADLHTWTSHTDAYNRTYLLCNTTFSTLYFVKEDDLFYSYDFYGSKKSLLFQFYLASFRILLSQDDKVVVNDDLPIHLFNHKSLLVLQDFFAPFFLFTKARFQSKIETAFEINVEKISVQSHLNVKVFGHYLLKREYEIQISNHSIQSISFTHKNKQLTYQCEPIS